MKKKVNVNSKLHVHINQVLKLRYNCNAVHILVRIDPDGKFPYPFKNKVLVNLRMKFGTE